MFLFEVILNALVLGGMYALVALGLNLQFGVARMMNLSYGEFFMAGAFAAFWTVMLWKLDPLLAMLASVPVSFVANWLIYRFLLLRLIRRSPDQDALDADVILVTFGLLFVFQGLAIGNHTVSVFVRTAVGTSTGVLLDPGGFGGRIVVKETF